VNFYIALQSKSLKDFLPLIDKYKLGVEIQDYCDPNKIDGNSHEEMDIPRIKVPSLHGPFSELVPASRDPEIRKVVKNRFNRAWEIAVKLNCKHLILHTGFIPKTYFPQDWLNRTINFWNEFLGDKKGEVEIHLENVYEDDYFLISDLIDAIKKPFFSACLDIGHVNANSSKSLTAWIKGLGNKIRYVHLHNNNGIYDDHFGLSQGKINIHEVLELLKTCSPNAICTIEVFPEKHIEPSILWLERNGFISG